MPAIAAVNAHWKSAHIQSLMKSVQLRAEAFIFTALSKTFAFQSITSQGELLTLTGLVGCQKIVRDFEEELMSSDCEEEFYSDCEEEFYSDYASDCIRGRSYGYDSGEDFYNHHDY